ncbi:MAG TPA: hypothetical protein VH677_02460 [Nitrososphaera sp.]|jgi:hypothetical protein
MVDPSPLPYGTLDYYQVHYIVETGDADTQQFIAKCEPITKGHFSDKRVVAVKWTGTSDFVEKLQADEHLTGLLKQVLLREKEVRIDPLDGHVRIYGRWNGDENLRTNPQMVEIADIIAKSIKSCVNPL